MDRLTTEDFIKGPPKTPRARYRYKAELNKAEVVHYRLRANASFRDGRHSGIRCCYV